MDKENTGEEVLGVEGKHVKKKCPFWRKAKKDGWQLVVNHIAAPWRLHGEGKDRGQWTGRNAE